MSSGRRTGIVKRFNDDRGHGFITPADGQGEVFVHHSALPATSFRPRLAEGDKVEFGIAFDEQRGKEHADRVELVGLSAPYRTSTRKRA